ncbi:DUF3842 family protein [Clostridiaceae bacterium]|nr:DUF3842 family protein [Lachnospiraceae bacterium]NBH19163.1 DUF3842 family protein [Clostridiaceae bacterium]
MKKITIIDGQGGKMGKTIVEQLKKQFPQQEILAVGTNSTATAAMLKAGADYGATGENPVIVAARDSDLIIGPIGIVIADSLHGEITPAMAMAVGQSHAKQLLMPVNRCNHHVIGTDQMSLNEIIALVIEEVRKCMKER